MKILFTAIILSFSLSSFGLSINGTYSGSECKTDKAMMWLSLDKDEYKERQLLIHTMVPTGGTFSFYVKPGNYQLRGSDEKGCEFFSKFSINNEDQKVQIALKESK